MFKKIECFAAGQGVGSAWGGVFRRAWVFAVLCLCGAAYGQGQRLSVSGKVVSVDLQAMQMVCEGRVGESLKKITVALPRATSIYYRWTGGVEDMREDDKIEVFGAEVNADKSVAVARPMIFKGKNTRGAELVQAQKDRINLRGRLKRRGEGWALVADGQEFVLAIAKDVVVLLCDDATPESLKAKQGVSFTGRLEGDRMTTVSQLYILAKSPSYDPDRRTTSVEGDRFIFRGSVRRVDGELGLLVGSGNREGKIVPLTVRWSGGWRGLAARAGGGEDLEPGRVALLGPRGGSGGKSVVFVLPDSESSRRFLDGAGRYSDVSMGEIVLRGEACSLRLAGTGKLLDLPASVDVFVCREAGEEDVHVGEGFLALGRIPADGRWLMENPDLLILATEGV